MGRNNLVNAIKICKCCLEEDGLKDMWKENYSEGSLETYGDMIRDCFVMTWYPPSKDKSEYICESCIIRLRVAVSFKKGMLLSDQSLKEYFDRESEPRVKLEAESDDNKETENLKTEHLENSVDSIKREIKIEVDESYTQTSDEYTEDDSYNYLKAVRTETLMQVEKIETLSRSERSEGSEYESDAPGPSTKKKLCTENIHRQCVTTNSRQNVEPSKRQSTEYESRRGSSLQVTIVTSESDIAIEYDKNQMGVDDRNLTTDHVQKPRQTIGDGLKKVPKTAAERSREFRARKALLKKQQEQIAMIKIATEDIRSAVPLKDIQVPGPSDVQIIEIRKKSAEATRRWRQNKKGSRSSKKHPKTAAQRMREYRARKKMAKTEANAVKAHSEVHQMQSAHHHHKKIS